VVSRHGEIAKYQMMITRKQDKDEMTFRVETKEEVIKLEKLKDEIERSIRDVIKIRGNVQFIPKGTIPEGAKKIEDQRTWD